MALRRVRFPAALDGSDLSLKVIAGGRRLGAGARHIDGIVLAFRRSFEAGIFFDRERAMENVAFDQGCTVQLDARCMDRTLDLSSDGQFLRDHIALNAGALVDQNVQRPHLPLNLAEHIQGTLAGDFAYDRHATTDGGHLIG